MINVGTAVGYLMLDSSNFKSGVRSAHGSLKTLRSESATTSDKFTAVGSAMTSVGSSLTKNVTLPLVGLGAAAVSVASNFQSSMSKVAAISELDTTGKEFDQLSQKAKDLGASTKFSASQAADAFTYMAMAGWDTESMLGGIDGIMSLAAASGEDLATTSDIVTDALTAFGMKADESAHFADVLAAASNSANTNVSMLGESFKYVAPVAGALGFSAEDTSVALGLMANSGIKASQAGTSLRAALASMASPSKSVSKYMEDYGISLTNSDGSMKSLMGVMQSLREKMGGLSEAEQASTATSIFGRQAMSGMLAIINASDEDFAKLTDNIYNADGTAQKMAETMQDNLPGKITILKSGLEGLGISIGEILVPMLISLVENITGFVDKLNSMDEGTKKTIVTILTVIASLGPLLLIFGKLSKTIGSVMRLISGAGGLSGILTALTGPIGIIIAAVAGLALAWATDFGGIRETTQEILDSIQGIISTVWEAIVELWNSNFLCIRDTAQVIWDAINLIFTTAFDLISNAFQIFSLLFQGDWKGAWDLVKESASEIWETIKFLFKLFLNFIVDTLIKIGVNLLAAAKKAFGKIKEGFKFVWNTIKEWFEIAINDPVGTVLSIGTALYDAGVSIFTSLWDGLKSVWEDLKSWVSDAVDWLKDKVTFWKNESKKVKYHDSPMGKITISSNSTGLDYVPENQRHHTSSSKSSSGKDSTSSGGDTYNFYSPEALTPTKAAQEMKRAKKEVALGFN